MKLSSILIKILILFSIYSITLTSLNVNAQSETLETKNSKIIDNIKKKDPTKAVSKNLIKNSKNKNRLNSDQKDLKIEIDTSTKLITLKRDQKQDFKIKINNSKTPTENDGKLIYSDKITDTVIEPVDGGIRQVINIKSKESPNQYTFKWI